MITLTDLLYLVTVYGALVALCWAIWGRKEPNNEDDGSPTQSDPGERL